jgi:nicotinamide-nucleotide adenylyltransferase
MKSLFIGRFQPVHLGHIDAIKQALKESDFLYIAIGSTQNNFRPNNPFTAGERFQMLEAALEEAKIPRSKYNIVTIPNIDNYALWVAHVQLYLPPFQKIYTGSDVVKELFENANLQLKKPYQIIDIKKHLKISSTIVREEMLKSALSGSKSNSKNDPSANAQKWEQLVPKSVTKLLQSWKATNRLKNIQESEK